MTHDRSSDTRAPTELLLFPPNPPPPPKFLPSLANGPTSCPGPGPEVETVLDSPCSLAPSWPLHAESHPLSFQNLSSLSCRSRPAASLSRAPAHPRPNTHTHTHTHRHQNVPTRVLIRSFHCLKPSPHFPRLTPDGIQVKLPGIASWGSRSPALSPPGFVLLLP